MEPVVQFVNALFEDIPMTEHRGALRLQILGKAEELYDELVDLGLSKGEAARRVIAAVDSQEDVLRQLGLPLGIIDSSNPQFMPSDSRRQAEMLEEDNPVKDPMWESPLDAALRKVQGLRLEATLETSDLAEMHDDVSLDHLRQTLPEDKLVLPNEETYNAVYWLGSLALYLGGPIWLPSTVMYWILVMVVYLVLTTFLKRRFGRPKSKGRMSFSVGLTQQNPVDKANPRRWKHRTNDTTPLTAKEIGRKLRAFFKE